LLLCRFCLIFSFWLTLSASFTQNQCVFVSFNKKSSLIWEFFYWRPRFIYIFDGRFRIFRIHFQVRLVKNINDKRTQSLRPLPRPTLYIGKKYRVRRGNSPRLCVRLSLIFLINLLSEVRRNSDNSKRSKYVDTSLAEFKSDSWVVAVEFWSRWPMAKLQNSN
jgi:hypothetical protein